MKCCTRCFNASEVVAFIKRVGTTGECDYCGAERVHIIPAEDLGEMFDELLGLYEEADEQKYHEDESLADLISNWNIFSGKLETNKQNAILDEIRLGPIS